MLPIAIAISLTHDGFGAVVLAFHSKKIRSRKNLPKGLVPNRGFLSVSVTAGICKPSVARFARFHQLAVSISRVMADTVQEVQRFGLPYQGVRHSSELLNKHGTWR
jgi:hypothetical protein